MIAIIKECMDVVKDETFPVEFRQQIKDLLIECKDEIDRLLIEFNT